MNCKITLCENGFIVEVTSQVLNDKLAKVVSGLAPLAESIIEQSLLAEEEKGAAFRLLSLFQELPYEDGSVKPGLYVFADAIDTLAFVQKLMNEKERL